MNKSIVVDIPLPATALWVGLLAFAAVFAIVSVIISHHWSYYGISNTNREFITALYYVGGIALLVIMGLSAAAYSV